MAQQISPLRCRHHKHHGAPESHSHFLWQLWSHGIRSLGSGARAADSFLSCPLPSSIDRSQLPGQQRAVTFTGTIIPESQAPFKPFWKMGSRHQLKLPAGVTMLLIWVPVPLGVPFLPLLPISASPIFLLIFLFIYMHISTRVIVKQTCVLQIPHGCDLFKAAFRG